MTPLNDLERLLATPKFGAQCYPELFRLLRESELAFLLPFHPEMEGSIGLKNGDALPPFVVWQNKSDGPRVPIFSSLERAQEACKKTGAHDKQYVICEMTGRELFHLISCQPHPIVLNPATTTPALFLDMEGVKQVADIARPEPGEKKEQQGTIQLLTAADYPTNLVQGLFQYLRERADVQAAWLGKVLNRAEPGTAYMIALLTTANHEELQKNLVIVAGSALPQKEDTCFVSFLDGANASAMAVVEKFTPFFAAPNYKGPGPLGGA